MMWRTTVYGGIVAADPENVCECDPSVLVLADDVCVATNPLPDWPVAVGNDTLWA